MRLQYLGHAKNVHMQILIIMQQNVRCVTHQELLLIMMKQKKCWKR
jgi:hypothetical protein